MSWSQSVVVATGSFNAAVAVAGALARGAAGEHIRAIARKITSGQTAATPPTG